MRYGARSWQPFEARSSQGLGRDQFDGALVRTVFELDTQLPALPGVTVQHGIADLHLGDALGHLAAIVRAARVDRKADTNARPEIARRAAADADPDSGPRAAVGAVDLPVALDVV